MNQIKRLILENDKKAIDIANEIDMSKTCMSFVWNGKVLFVPQDAIKVAEFLNTQPCELYPDDLIKLLKGKKATNKTPEIIFGQVVYKRTWRVTKEQLNKFNHLKLNSGCTDNQDLLRKELIPMIDRRNKYLERKAISQLQKTKIFKNNDTGKISLEVLHG